MLHGLYVVVPFRKASTILHQGTDITLRFESLSLSLCLMLHQILQHPLLFPPPLTSRAAQFFLFSEEFVLLSLVSHFWQLTMTRRRPDSLYQRAHTHTHTHTYTHTHTQTHTHTHTHTES